MVARNTDSRQMFSETRGRTNGLTIGPEDAGRRMSLERFSRANAVPGYIYELAERVIEVTNIPSLLHNLTVDRVHGQVHLYQADHPAVVHGVLGSHGSKIELWGRESERHPDLSIYLTPPPEGISQPWDRWIPDIVVEVVSDSSARRDYHSKRSEYLAAGVREYWIIDPRKSSALILIRRADSWIEKRLTRRGKWRSPLLPGFALDLSKVFVSSRRRN